MGTARRRRRSGEAPELKAKPGHVTSFRWRELDIYAIQRCLALLGLRLPAQVVRLGLAHLLRTVEAEETPSAARRLLGADLERVEAIKRGGARMKRPRSSSAQAAA